MLDYVLVDSLDERIIRGWRKMRRFRVWGWRSHRPAWRVYSLLKQVIMDILDRLEPRQAPVMDMVCFVVEDHEFIEIPDNLGKITFESVVAPVGFYQGNNP